MFTAKTISSQADDGAGFARAAEILAEAEAVRALETAVIEKEAAVQILAHARREVRRIVRAVLGEVVLGAADGVDPRGGEARGAPRRAGAVLGEVVLGAVEGVDPGEGVLGTEPVTRAKNNFSEY